MSRWRPPQPKSSAYITPEGAQALTAELKHLWKVERPTVTDAVHEAAKNGDRSENGDYIYGKKRLREIDRRVRYLSKRLDILTIVENTPANTDKIYFGAWVTLEKDDGSEVIYRIVGPDEFDVGAGKISMDSPLARGLLGKEVGDEVTVKTAENEVNYYVSDIRYQPAGNFT